jgi:lipooligosaccharide transport system permease protein
LTATMERDEAYTWVFRFVVTPLFLLSGTFFPLDSLPPWVVVVANLTPLYHGIELIRQLTIFDFSPLSAGWHLLYLVAFLVAASRIALRNFEKRLVV